MSNNRRDRTHKTRDDGKTARRQVATRDNCAVGAAAPRLTSYNRDAQMRLLLLALLVVANWGDGCAGGGPPICSTPTSLRMRGVDIVATSRGRVLLLAFIPLQCADCQDRLIKLNRLASTMNDVRVVVVAHNFESNVVVSRVQSLYPSLIVESSSDGWRTFSAAKFDVFLIDRCGRLSAVLPQVQFDATTVFNMLDAIRDARQHARCGFCQYDTPQQQRTSTLPKSVNAYLKEDNGHLYQSRRQSIEQRRNDVYYSQRQPETAYTPTASQTVAAHEEDRSRMRPSYQNDHRSDPMFHKIPPAAMQTTTTASSTTTDNDGDYYADDVVVTTTPSPQTQIPKPPAYVFGWPTPPTNQRLKNFGAAPVSADGYERFYDASDNNIPCSAYTDDVCYQQQERLGRDGLSKCCSKGVYLTDVCVQGKCSKNTVQLCCFQKFVQAKYTCCEDSSQGDGTNSTNKFNKCCHEGFVTDDPCCPSEDATKYWQSVYEVCYPNTKVDYSGVRHEVHFAEGVRVVDLSVSRQWDFACRHGGNRPQYAFLPPTTTVAP